MIINIHGFPPRYSKEGIKALISRIVRLNQFLLDEPEPDGRWLKVKVGCASEEDGQRLAYVLNNFEIDGFKLHVSFPAKAKTVPLLATAGIPQSSLEGHFSQKSTQSKQLQGILNKPEGFYRKTNTTLTQNKPHYASNPMENKRQNSRWEDRSQYMRVPYEYPESKSATGVKFSNESQQNERTNTMYNPDKIVSIPYRPTETNTNSETGVSKFKDPRKILQFVGDHKAVQRDTDNLNEKFQNFHRDSLQDSLVEKNEVMNRKRQYPNDDQVTQCYQRNTYRNKVTKTLGDGDRIHNTFCPSSIKDSKKYDGYIGSSDSNTSNLSNNNSVYCPIQQRVIDNCNPRANYKSNTGENDSISRNKLFYRRNEVINQEINQFNEKVTDTEKNRPWMPREATIMRPEITHNDVIPDDDRNQQAYGGGEGNVSNQKYTLQNQSGSPKSIYQSDMYSPIKIGAVTANTCFNDDYDTDRSERFEQLYHENTATSNYDQSNNLNDQMSNSQRQTHDKQTSDIPNSAVNTSFQKINERAISFRVETNNLMQPTGITPNPPSQNLSACDINTIHRDSDKLNLNQTVKPKSTSSLRKDEDSKRVVLPEIPIDEIITPETMDIPINEILVANPNIALTYKKQKSPAAIAKNLLSRVIVNRLLDLTKINDQEFVEKVVIDVLGRASNYFPKMTTAEFTMRHMLGTYDRYPVHKFKPEHIRQLATQHIKRKNNDPKFDVENFNKELSLATRPQERARPVQETTLTSPAWQPYWTPNYTVERALRDLFPKYRHLPRKFRFCARNNLTARFNCVLGPNSKGRLNPELCGQFLAMQPADWFQQYVQECKMEYQKKGCLKTIKNLEALVKNATATKLEAYAMHVPNSYLAGNVTSASIVGRAKAISDPKPSSLASSYQTFLEAKNLENFTSASNVTSGIYAAKPVATVAPRNSIKPTSVKEQGHPTNMMQIGLRSNMMPQGPPINMMQQGHPTNMMQQGLPPNMMPQRPPFDVMQQGPPLNMMPQEPPVNMTQQGLPPNIMPQGAPINMKQQGLPPNVMPQRPPINMMQQGPHLNLMPQGPPHNMMSQDPPTNFMQQEMSTNTMGQAPVTYWSNSSRSNMTQQGAPPNMTQQCAPPNMTQVWRTSQNLSKASASMTPKGTASVTHQSTSWAASQKMTKPKGGPVQNSHKEKATKAIDLELDSLSEVVKDACQQWNMFSELEDKAKEVALDAGATFLLLVRNRLSQRMLDLNTCFVVISAVGAPLPAKTDVEAYIRRRWVGGGPLKIRVASRKSYLAKVYSFDTLDDMLAAREVYLRGPGQELTLVRFEPKVDKVSYRLRALERRERAARLTGALAGRAPADVLHAQTDPDGSAGSPSSDNEWMDEDCMDEE